jgi:hypothetical protein
MRLEHEKLYNMFKSTDSSNWELAWQILLGWTPNEMKDFFMWFWRVVKEDMFKQKMFKKTAIMPVNVSTPSLFAIMLAFKSDDVYVYQVTLNKESFETSNHILPYHSWGKISKETIAETINGTS